MVASRQAEDVVERIVWDRYRVHGVQRAAKKCNLFEFMESNVLQKNEIPNLLETKFQWSPKFKSVVLLYALYGQCVMNSVAYSSLRNFEYFIVIFFGNGYYHFGIRMLRTESNLSSRRFRTFFSTAFYVEKYPQKMLNIGILNNSQWFWCTKNVPKDCNTISPPFGCQKTAEAQNRKLTTKTFRTKRIMKTCFPWVQWSFSSNDQNSIRIFNRIAISCIEWNSVL